MADTIAVERSEFAQARRADNRTQIDTCMLVQRLNEIRLSLSFLRLASVLVPKLKRISTALAEMEIVGSSPTGATPLTSGLVMLMAVPREELYRLRLSLRDYLLNSRRHPSNHRQPQAATSIASEPNKCEVSYVG